MKNDFPLKALEMAPGMGIFIIDESFRYHLLRGPLHVKNGYYPKDFEGKNMYQVFHGDKKTISKLEPLYYRALKEDFSTRYFGNDGSAYWVSFRPFVHDKKRYALAYVRDVTDIVTDERRASETESRERLAKLVGKFSRSAIDLIHPMTHHALDYKSKDKLYEVWALINGLLMIAGNYEYEMKTMFVDEVLKEAHIKSKSHLHIDFEPHRIVGDSNALLKAFTGLFLSIPGSGWVESKNGVIQMVFEPPDDTCNIYFDIAQAVIKGHGGTFTRTEDSKKITWKVEGLPRA